MRGAKFSSEQLTPLECSKTSWAATIGEHKSFLQREKISSKQLAALVGVSLRTLRKWERAGGTPPRYRRGRSLLYLADEVHAWVRNKVPALLLPSGRDARIR